MLKDKSANSNTILPTWSLNKISNSLSFTTIKGIHNEFLLAVQVHLFAIDNSGIGHLLEHMIVNKTLELANQKKLLKNSTFVTGVTYPNYVVFYIGAQSYEEFCAVIKAFIHVYSSLSSCDKIYTTLVDDKSDSNSVISELERREKDRISVIWQNFYEKRFTDTEYRFNSGGHSTMLKSRSLEEVIQFWEEHCFSKVEIVMCAHELEDRVKNQFLQLYNASKSKLKKPKINFEKCVIPICYNRYKTKYASSFSYGVGIINKINLRTDYLESLLFNVVMNNNKVKKGMDFLYDNATPYGMFYFGIHTKKINKKIDADFLFDLFLNTVLEANEDFIEKVSKNIIKRLQLLEINDRQKCLELTARILQRFRRNQELDESIILPGKYASFNGKQLKKELINFVTYFANDDKNKEVLFCYQ